VNGTRLLLIGTGGIATQHIAEFGRVSGCAIVACVDAIPGRAETFAREHGITRSFRALDEAIAWNEFDAAINGTPDDVHKPTTLQLIAANKPIFCEKPLAPSYSDALEMTEAAEAAGLVNMVNLTYRNSPALQKARSMVQAGELGPLRHVEAAYRQSWLTAETWGDWRTQQKWLWRLSSRHGSTGVLGDVGVHILDFATYGAADKIVRLNADLVVFPKVEGDAICEYKLDANDSMAMTARFAGGALATIVATRYATGHINDLSLTLHGLKGALRVQTDGVNSKLEGCFGKGIDPAVWREIPTQPTARNAARFIQAFRTGINGEPSFRRAAEMQRLIDGAFESGRTGMAVQFS
jgi:predicted dehydrogenase